MTEPRHFLTGQELAPDELGRLLDRATELKAGREGGEGDDSLRGRTVALFFEKPSTRTRVSFQVGVAELGGHPLPLRADELQLGRGESIADTARVLSRFVHAIVIRSGSHETVAELAPHAEIPVINGLTPLHHPCQALADLMTLKERLGGLDGVRLAYVGDGNNVARSLAILGRAAGVAVTGVTAGELTRYEPHLADGLAGGAYFPQDAQVQPMLATAHLLRGLDVRYGVEVVEVGTDRNGVVNGPEPYGLCPYG